MKLLSRFIRYPTALKNEIGSLGVPNKGVNKNASYFIRIFKPGFEAYLLNHKGTQVFSATNECKATNSCSPVRCFTVIRGRLYDRKEAKTYPNSPLQADGVLD